MKVGGENESKNMFETR